MLSKAVGCIVAISIGILAGCASDKSSHPAFCRGTDCIPSITPSVNLGASGGTGSTGIDTPQAGAGSVVSIQGQIVEIEDPNFGASLGFAASGSFIVQAPTAGGLVFDSTVQPVFALDGILRSNAAWLVAKPATATDLLPGLVAFDSTQKTAVVIPVVRKSSLELVASVLTAPTTLDSAQAQLVLRFVDGNGDPVSGIQVAIQGAERVAYDLGAGYTDSASGTSNRGLAIVLNVPATRIPLVTVVALSGTVTAQLSLFVVAGAATAVEIGVSKN